MKALIMFVIVINYANVVLACSKQCVCRYNDKDVIIGVNCSNSELNELPKLIGDYETNITHLDLSDSRLSTFPYLPTEYHSLTHINCSRNNIDLKSFPTDILHKLQHLDLSRNNIDSGKLFPVLLNKLETLVTINFSANPLTTIPNYLQHFNLQSIDFSYCQISKFHGPVMLQGFPRLEILSFRGNPMRSVTDLASKSLIFLDLSHCKLTHLQANVVENLPNLIHLNLAHNSRLSLTRRSGEIVHSESLKILDLSYCNMESIEISGFPNLTGINLRGNLIKSLKHADFSSNDALENIDLSLNAIAYIAPDAFYEVTMLKHLDISFNMIRHVARHTFENNKQLTTINLSRNFLAGFNCLSSSSLTHLNVSWCEVLTIDEDALNDLPELIDLDLSNNLFSELPKMLHSKKLERIDLRMCRIATIRNGTFNGFPKLTQLQLSSNRFTTPFRAHYFEDNYFLREIGLGDNPWRCDCADPEFFEFYVFISEEPMRLNDALHLHCFSPEKVYGLDWSSACENTWNADHLYRTSSRRTTSVVLILLLIGISILLLWSVVTCLKDARQQKCDQLERDNNLELTREAIRHNEAILEQDSQQNAPNPRESHPPCYDDAILLPKFTGSFASLKGRWISNDEDTVDSPLTTRNRCRSEEVLSQRESIFDQQRQLRRQIIAEANRNLSIYTTRDIPQHTTLY